MGDPAEKLDDSEVLEAAYDEQFSEEAVEAEKSTEQREELAQETTEEAAEEVVEEVIQELLQPHNHWHNDDKAFFSSLGNRELQEQYIAHEARIKQRYDAKASEANSANEALGYFQETLTPIVPDLNRRGINPSQFLAQAVQLHQDLATNPAETLMRLAGDYRVDLEQQFKEQPYVDPQTRQLQNELSELREQNALREREREQAARQSQQLAEQRAVDQFKTFASETDASGALLHPHAEDSTVMQYITEALNTRQAVDLKGAYAWAIERLSAHPLFQQQQERAKAETQEKVERAKSASKTVEGDPPKDGPIDEEAFMLSQLEAAGYE